MRSKLSPQIIDKLPDSTNMNNNKTGEFYLNYNDNKEEEMKPTRVLRNKQTQEPQQPQQPQPQQQPSSMQQQQTQTQIQTQTQTQPQNNLGNTPQVQKEIDQALGTASSSSNTNNNTYSQTQDKMQSSPNLYNEDPSFIPKDPNSQFNSNQTNNNYNTGNFNSQGQNMNGAVNVNGSGSGSGSTQMYDSKNKTYYNPNMNRNPIEQNQQMPSNMVPMPEMSIYANYANKATTVISNVPTGVTQVTQVTNQVQPECSGFSNPALCHTTTVTDCANPAYMQTTYCQSSTVLAQQSCSSPAYYRQYTSYCQQVSSNGTVTTSTSSRYSGPNLNTTVSSHSVSLNGDRMNYADESLTLQNYSLRVINLFPYVKGGLMHNKYSILNWNESHFKPLCTDYNCSYLLTVTILDKYTAVRLFQNDLFKHNTSYFMETQISPNLLQYIVQTQTVGSRTSLKEVMGKYLDGALKWALKELKTLELYNDRIKGKKLNVKVYIGMDSLNGSSSGCNFIVNPTCSTQTTVTSTSLGGYGAGPNAPIQVSHSQTQSQYYNSFNGNVFNPNLISPMYVYSVAQHLNQIIMAINSLLLVYPEVEKKGNYVELMSTVFEGVRGSEYYANYEKEASKKELEKMRRLMKVGYNSGLVRDYDIMRMSSVLTHNFQNVSLQGNTLNVSNVAVHTPVYDYNTTGTNSLPSNAPGSNAYGQSIPIPNNSTNSNTQTSQFSSSLGGVNYEQFNLNHASDNLNVSHSYQKMISAYN